MKFSNKAALTIASTLLVLAFSNTYAAQGDDYGTQDVHGLMFGERDSASQTGNSANDNEHGSGSSAGRDAESGNDNGRGESGSDSNGANGENGSDGDGGNGEGGHGGAGDND